MKEEIIKTFRQIAQNPYDYLRELKKESGKKMIGSTCVFTPEEIIIAAGAHPFRIFGKSDNLANADAHIQAYACSMVRGMLEDGFSATTDFIDGVVFPHTCDSIQRLSDIWRMNIKSLHFDLLLPVKLDSPLSKSYFVNVLERFKKDLEQSLSVKIEEQALKEAIKLMNKIRYSLHKIYQLRSDNPGIISGSELSTIVKASMVMDKHKLAALLDSLIEELQKEAQGTENKKRVLISGTICSHPDIYNMIKQKGAVVVWDDLCSGSRYFEGIVDEDKQAIQAIADRYTSRYVCPAKHLGVEYQMENLKKLVKKHRIDAILFMTLKFCEPYSFDYPDIKKELEKMEIPFMMIEMEHHNEVDEQIRTRIETILEIL